MRALLRFALCLSLALPLAAGETNSASASATGLGRYRVTIAPGMVDDTDAFVSQLLAMCRCRLEPYAEMGFDGVMIRASASAAKMLGNDPRIVRVEEMQGEEPAEIAPAVHAETAIGARPATDAYATPWDSGAYGYDGAGNVSTIGTAKKYVYDKLGRLQSAGESTNGHRQEYTYDRNGNILTIRTYKPGQAVDLKTLTVSESTNRVTTFAQTGIPDVAAEYDAAGRMKKMPGATFQYDAGDMVVESKIGNVRAVHLYTASDERIATIGITDANVQQGSDWTIRDMSGQVLRRFKKPSATAQWVWDEDYIYRDGQLLAAEVATQERTLHFHPDHLGTPRLITGNGGAEVSTRELHAFGEGIGTQDNERRKFTGHERDAESLDYMHARYYAVQWGRFLSEDPILGNPREPQSWNRYAYVSNNPVNRIDPDGRATRIAEAIATSLEASGSSLRFAGASLNGGTNLGVVADATLATLGDLVGGAGDMFRVGDAVGTAVGEGRTGEDLLRAAAQDTGRASALVLTLAAPVSGVGRTSATQQLATKVDEVHAALDPIAQNMRTTAGLRTSAGDVMAGGARDLTPAQRAVVARNGDTAARLPGQHAEITAMNAANKAGAAPRAMVASRPFCSGCRAAIEASGGKITSPTTAKW